MHVETKWRYHHLVYHVEATIGNISDRSEKWSEIFPIDRIGNISDCDFRYCKGMMSTNKSVFFARIRKSSRFYSRTSKFLYVSNNNLVEQIQRAEKCFANIIEGDAITTSVHDWKSFWLSRWQFAWTDTKMQFVELHISLCIRGLFFLSKNIDMKKVGQKLKEEIRLQFLYTIGRKITRNSSNFDQ